jgi:pimeloyl-ACP methyl ester carboxylesterase
MAETPTTRGGELFFPAADGPFFEWHPTNSGGDDTDLICAELSRLAYAPPPRIETELRRIGFDFLEPLESRRLFSVRAAADGFVCRDPRDGTLFAVFRGTETGNLDDLLANLLVDPVEWRPGTIVHRGYGRTFDELRGPLEPWLLEPPGRTIATGHSLGGALATLCAADFPAAELVTFGAPRVGTDSLCLRPGKPGRRYVHCCDLVPRVPPARFTEVALDDLADGLLDNLAPPAGWLAIASQGALRQAARLAAETVARIAEGRGWDHAFVHPGPLVYLDRRGGVHIEPSAAVIAADQRQARSDYREAIGAGGTGSNATALLETLAGLSTALLRGDHDATAAARERLFAELSRSDAMGRVVVRDLADHAAIHYVRVLLQAESGSGD